MKKKIFAFLLSSMMLMGMMPATVWAEDVQNTEHNHCVCGMKEVNHAHVEEKWEGIYSLDQIYHDGNYYLTRSVKNEGRDLYWECKYNVKLCLNGQTITGADGYCTIGVDTDKNLEITDCQENVGVITHAENEGGVGIVNYGTITLWNGAISGNTGTTDAGGYGYGGGVYNEGSTFTMFGGSISGNSASKLGGGVYNKDSTFVMYGGTISGNTSTFRGGGVANMKDKTGSTFTMMGGTISGNTSGRSGGGLYNGKSTFKMSGTAVIRDNIATSDWWEGGGVCNYTGTFILESGTISGNKSKGNGGGVANLGEGNDPAVFTMNGGTISDNEAEGNGGGVWNHVDSTYDNETVTSKAIFTSGGGIITGNTVNNGNGGGVYSDDSVVLSGTPAIADNTTDNLYLVSEKLVSAAGLATGVRIGVNTEIVPTNTTPVIITNDVITENYFVSDNSVYETGMNSEGYIVMNLKDGAPVPETPTIIEGANGTYTQGGQDGISFRSNDAYSNFQKVLVDGNEVAPENYTTREGSIIVTLKPEYLSTLSSGTHTISIVSVGGTASTNFTVQTASTPNPTPTPSEPTTEPTPSTPSAPTTEVTPSTTVTPVTQVADEGAQNSQTAESAEVSSPKTAEDNSVGWCVALLVLSCGALAYIGIRKRFHVHSVL